MAPTTTSSNNTSNAVAAMCVALIQWIVFVIVSAVKSCVLFWRGACASAFDLEESNPERDLEADNARVAMPQELELEIDDSERIEIIVVPTARQPSQSVYIARKCEHETIADEDVRTAARAQVAFVPETSEDNTVTASDEATDGAAPESESVNDTTESEDKEGDDSAELAVPASDEDEESEPAVEPMPESCHDVASSERDDDDDDACENRELFHIVESATDGVASSDVEDTVRSESEQEQEDEGREETTYEDATAGSFSRAAIVSSVSADDCVDMGDSHLNSSGDDQVSVSSDSTISISSGSREEADETQEQRRNQDAGTSDTENEDEVESERIVDSEEDEEQSTASAALAVAAIAQIATTTSASSVLHRHSSALRDENRELSRRVQQVRAKALRYTDSREYQQMRAASLARRAKLQAAKPRFQL